LALNNLLDGGGEKRENREKEIVSNENEYLRESFTHRVQSNTITSIVVGCDEFLKRRWKPQEKKESQEN
jgi:hypothetical protein